MADELSVFKETLRKMNPEFRKLEEQHHRLELELNELTRHRTLTPQEELYKKQIQVEKLHMKDRIEALIRQHQKRRESH